MYDKQALLIAINHLVLSERAETHYNLLESLLGLPVDTPVKLTDEAEMLNALLELGREDRDAYGRVMELVDRKRVERGWTPLLKPEPQGFNRNEYQRDFMYQKRQRERRAVEIENMLRPARDKLIGNDRLEFMRRTSARWKESRDKMMTAARQASGGTLSKDQVSAILKAFWERVDRELDEAEAETMRKIRGT